MPVKKFEVTLRYTETNRAVVTVEAETLEQAQDKAYDIGADEIDEWQLIHGDLAVETVEPLHSQSKRKH